MYVPFFRCESFPYISRRADWCPCALFPSHSPCTPLVFISVPSMSFQFPFVSLSFPAAFLSCRLPIASPHFLALPCISPLLPNIPPKKHGFSSVVAIRTSKNTEVFKIFGNMRQEPQKESSLGPLFCDTGSPKTTFSETSSNCRAVRGGGHVSDCRGGVRGGYPLSSLRCPTRRAMSADVYIYIYIYMCNAVQGNATQRSVILVCNVV